ncbi:MAG TPA: hypothetical protein VGR48_09500, partial [Terriglobales bacterium]|nr:hypothetical protein [Terriglobales bacterium]
PGAASRLLRRAYQQKLRLRAARRQAMGTPGATSYSASSITATAFTASTPSYGGWVPLGPAPLNSNATGSLDDQNYGPVVGRATSVVVDPGDPTGNTVYVGGAYGGVWKSTNAAAADPSAVTWTPLTDQQATLATGSLALQPSSSGPSNVILVGTGEADFSIDSYYGLGILRSADAGNTWTLINSSTSGPGFSGLAFAKIAFSTDNPNLVVAAATGAGNDEGASNQGAGNQPGLYTSTDGGQTWAEGFRGIAPGLGATSVIYNSGSHKFFAFLQYLGYYTSRDGMNWTRLVSQPGSALQSCPTGNAGVPVCNVFRGEMAVVPGRNELYTWYVTIDNQGNIGDGGIYRTTDGGSSWHALNETGITNCGDGTGNGCGTEQGWFNLTLAAVPNGAGTDLYAGTVNIYKCSITASNSLCGANPFINLTHVYGCTPVGSLAHVHPDQHGMSFLSLGPSQVVMYFANDGGIYRALNGYTLKSGTCGATPNAFQDLNGTMGSMAQFVDFSNSPTDVATLLGGTQDNGSPATDASHGANWISVNAGDGGYNAIDPASGNWFTSNTDVSVQRCGAGINCLAQTFFPVVTNSTVGGDHGFFYTPFILDPQATERMMVGTCRLWRGNSDGSGFTPLGYNFDTVMNQVPNQSCSGNETQLIRSIAAGGPDSGNGSSVIYVGTEGGFDPASGSPVSGHVWVTNNADLGPFTWMNSLTPSNGPYAISSIAVDSSDPTGNTAYATVMGFGPGGVFQTTNQGASWNLGPSSNLPSAPANAFVIDPDDSATFYVATDVGVYTSHDLINWIELGRLPSVAVLQLQMFESGGVKQLRAGTYGRGVWSYDIPYLIRITTPHVHLFPGQSGTINGIITGYNGYSSPVNIACPSTVSFGTCTGTTVTPMPLGTAFSLSITAASGVQGDSVFEVQGTGTDPAATAETAQVTVSVNDYALNGPSTLTVNRGATSGDANFYLGVYNAPITLSCSNLPTGASCNFYPSSLLLPPSNVTADLTVSAASTTPVGTSTITVSASSPGQPSPKTASIALTVSSSPDYSITVTPSAGATVPGGTTSAQITLSPSAGYPGPVSLSCTSRTVTCTFAPSGAIALAASPATVTATISVPFYWPYPEFPGESTVAFIATAPGTADHYAATTVTVMDFALASRSNAAAVVAGQTGQYELFVSPFDHPFTNSVSFSCSGLPKGATCSFSPATVTPNGSPAIVVVSVSTPKTLAALRLPAAPAIQAQLMLALLLPGMVIAISGNVRSKKTLFAALLILVLVLVILLPACGGGGSSSVAPPPPPPPPPPPSAPPPPVSYNFTVTATSGTVQHQLPLTLVVQGN